MQRPTRPIALIVLLGLIATLSIYVLVHAYHWRTEYRQFVAEWSALVARTIVSEAGSDWRLPESRLRALGIGGWTGTEVTDRPGVSGVVADGPSLSVIAVAILDGEGRVLSAAPAGFALPPEDVRRWVEGDRSSQPLFEVADTLPGAGLHDATGGVGILVAPVLNGPRGDERVVVVSELGVARHALRYDTHAVFAAMLPAAGAMILVLVLVCRRIDGVIARQYRALVENERELSAKNLALEREMHDRFEAELELGESEERFRSAFESAAHGMALNAPGGRFVRTNRTLLSILGYGADQILSMGFRDVLHPDDRACCWDQLRALLNGEARSVSRDVRVLRATGDPLWVMLSVSLVRDREGNAEHFVSQILDINEQKQAVAALRESEERFRSLVEGTLQGMVIDAGGALRFCNEAFARMFGYSSVDSVLRLREIAPLYAPEDREAAVALHGRCLSGDIPDRFEAHALRKDGTVICVELVMRPISWMGDPAVQTTVTDITARKAAEQALRASERRLANAQRIAGLGNWDLVCATGELRWSAEVSRIFGVGSEPSSGDVEALLAFVHPADQERVRDAVEKAVIEGAAVNIEHRILRADGSEAHIHHQAEAVIGAPGAPERVTGTLLDITDRKRAEEKAQEQYRFLQTLIDAMPMPIFYKDAQGIYTGCNKAFEEFLGRPRDQIIGHDVFQVAPRDLAQKYYVADKELMDRGGNQVYEAKVQYADGSRRSVIFHKATIADAKGRVEGLIGGMLDITDLKSAQDALQKSEELHRTFAADAAHELRTPLAIMRLQLDELGESEAARNLRDDVESMARLVEQLLAATRLDFLAIGPDERADISRVATNVAAYLAPIAFNANRSIEVLGAEKPVLVRGNGDALEQAVRNLVENAIKYSARGTTVTLRVSDEPMIQVRDRGRGVPEELRKQIFERFQRADRRSSGAGLGLSIVQRAVEAHGGTVDVADAIDGGAVFTIRLPPLAGARAAE